jgi:hypothetical protein
MKTGARATLRLFSLENTQNNPQPPNEKGTPQGA